MVSSFCINAFKRFLLSEIWELGISQGFVIFDEMLDGVDGLNSTDDVSN